MRRLTHIAVILLFLVGCESKSAVEQKTVAEKAKAASQKSNTAKGKTDATTSSKVPTAELEVTLQEGHDDYSEPFLDGSQTLANAIDGFGSNRDHIHVLITNRSKISLYVWPLWSRYGYKNIEFHLSDPKGTKYRITRHSVEFDSEDPNDPFVILPGKTYVIDCFIYGWKWTPELKPGEYKLTGYAVFNTMPVEGEDDRGIYNPILFGKPFLGEVRSNISTFQMDVAAE